eukprot:365042-Chlamydomonas_euryale.AAC.46
MACVQPEWRDGAGEDSTSQAINPSKCGAFVPLTLLHTLAPGDVLALLVHAAVSVLQAVCSGVCSVHRAPIPTATAPKKHCSSRQAQPWGFHRGCQSARPCQEACSINHSTQPTVSAQITVLRLTRASNAGGNDQRLGVKTCPCPCLRYLMLQHACPTMPAPAGHVVPSPSLQHPPLLPFPLLLVPGNRRRLAAPRVQGAGRHRAARLRLPAPASHPPCHGSLPPSFFPAGVLTALRRPRRRTSSGDSNSTMPQPLERPAARRGTRGGVGGGVRRARAHGTEGGGGG